MKIAYICEFSHPSICGVWNRVHHLAKEMVKKGHKVHVLSSNLIKNTGKTSKREEFFEGIYFHRFPVKFSFGENALFWKFKKKLIEINPDVIDAQVYRHPHTTTAPKTAKKIGAKSILTTHAPFVEKELRSWSLNLAVNFYDLLFGKRILHSYQKIITISKWEDSFLSNLGIKKSKTLLVPNGIGREFLKIEKKGNKNTILFFGRVSPIKNVEILIKSLNLVNKSMKLLLVGPVEEKYMEELKEIIGELGLERRIKFVGPIYGIKNKIKIMEKAGIFILPSKREGMPQSLLEAMAAGKIVISSDTQGGKELVSNGKNGFLFKKGDEKELARKINYVFENYNKMAPIRKNAKKYASNLTWDKISDKLEKIYLK